MRIVTNPGSNLSSTLAGRYDIAVIDQKIAVDGREVSTRQGVPLATVDEWLKTAAERPRVLATTAAEFLDLFREVAKRDREILVIATSRKIITTHDSALMAARTLKSLTGFEDVRVAVIDTKLTDVGAGMATLVAAEGARSGLPLAEVVSLVEAFVAEGALAFTVKTLDNIAKSGRATFLRAWLADRLDRSPLLTMTEGEVRSVSSYPRSQDAIQLMVEHIAGRVGADRRVWLAISHTGEMDRVRRLREGLGRRMAIVYEWTREMHPYIYMHLGPGALAAFAFPIGSVARMPAPPTS